MSTISPAIDKLIHAFCCLPGVGEKSAQRMAFHLLQRNRQAGNNLAASLSEAMHGVGNCKSCRTFTEVDICEICRNPNRDHSLLCVVESPIDVVAIEKSGIHKGLYFVLMGHLSPIEGIGPEDLGINLLQQKLANPNLKEVILATNTTVEGEATAYYIAELCKDYDISVTRIAHGVPLGGELLHFDGGTLSRAFAARAKIES